MTTMALHRPQLYLWIVTGEQYAILELEVEVDATAELLAKGQPMSDLLACKNFQCLRVTGDQGNAEGRDTG